MELLLNSEETLRTRFSSNFFQNAISDCCLALVVEALFNWLYEGGTIRRTYTQSNQLIVYWCTQNSICSNQERSITSWNWAFEVLLASAALSYKPHLLHSCWIFNLAGSAIWPRYQDLIAEKHDRSRGCNGWIEGSDTLDGHCFGGNPTWIGWKHVHQEGSWARHFYSTQKGISVKFTHSQKWCTANHGHAWTKCFAVISFEDD